ncbi:MAG: carboxypeptidase-like regulatory domain-containing protein [Chloroflexota bacterium]
MLLQQENKKSPQNSGQTDYRHFRVRILLSIVCSLLISGLVAQGIGSSTIAAQLSPQQQIQPDALGSISGTVTDEAGNPIAGATVEILGRTFVYNDWDRDVYGIDYKLLTSTTTDADGNYYIGALSTNIYHIQATAPDTFFIDTLWRKSADDMTQESADIPVSGNDVADIDITMPLGGRISGLLSTTEGLDFSYYSVNVYTAEDGYYHSANRNQFPSDSNSYQTNNLPDGVYSVCTSAYQKNERYDRLVVVECYDDHIVGIQSAQTVSVTAETVIPDVDFKLGASRQYAQVSGTLIGNDGKPAANVIVRANPVEYNPYPAPNADELAGQTTTDSLGRYILDRLGPYAYYLRFFTGNTLYVPQYLGGGLHPSEVSRLPLEEGTVLVNVDDQLNVGGQISGKVTIQGTEFPTSGTVTAYFREDGFYFSRRTNIDAATGEYILMGLPEGNYELRASGRSASLGPYSYLSGQPAEAVMLISITLDSRIEGIDISLAEAQFEGRIEGTVTDIDGPVYGIQVELRRGAGSIFFTFTDEEGRYAIDGLDTGSYYIYFSDPSSNYFPQYYEGHDSNVSASSIRVVDGETVSGVDAAMVQKETIRGTVLLNNGSSAAGYSVNIQRLDNSLEQRTTLTDGNGHFTFSELRPGTYTVKVIEPYKDDEPNQSIEERTVHTETIQIDAADSSAEIQSRVIQLGAGDLENLEPILYMPVMLN